MKARSIHDNQGGRSTPIPAVGTPTFQKKKPEATEVRGVSDHGEFEPAPRMEPLPAEVREGIKKGLYPPW